MSPATARQQQQLPRKQSLVTAPQVRSSCLLSTAKALDILPFPSSPLQSAGRWSQNSDALTPAALTRALPAVAVPGHWGWRMLCSRSHSLPCVLGTSARKGIPALPTLPAPSRITTKSNSHSLPPPGLLLPQTCRASPTRKGAPSGPQRLNFHHVQVGGINLQQALPWEHPWTPFQRQ